MSNCVKLPKSEVNIFNLPEEIFRVIFSYIDAEDLHLNLKSTCQRIRDYVTNYVEWEQTIIMLYRGIFYLYSMEAIPMIHMIKFAGKNPAVCTKETFPEVPNQRQYGVYERLVFAATIQQRIVIGVDYRCGSLEERGNRKSLEFFSLEKDEWIRIYRNLPEENNSATYDVPNDSDIIYSQIGESNIILFYTENGMDNFYEENGIDDFYTENGMDINFIELLYFHKNEVTDSLNGTLTYSSYCLDVPKEMRSLRNFCVIEKSKYECLVVGGWCYSDPESKEQEADKEEEEEEKEEGEGEEKDEDEEKIEEEEDEYEVDDEFICYKQTVWSGCLSQDKTQVIWKDTGHRIPFMGHSHRQVNKCFCVDEDIFLSYHNTGEKSCHLGSHNYDRYNWEEKKYYRNVFSPTSLSNEYTGVSGNIYENKEFVVVAVWIDHLMERMGRHVSVWLPINRMYSKRQPLVFTTYEGFCVCKYDKCKFCGCMHFGEQCNNAIGSEANNIFFLPILN